MKAYDHELAASLHADDGGASLRALLRHGLDANYRLEGGATALHQLAIQDSGAELQTGLLMDILVAHGADPNARADGMFGAGWTPLHLAVFEGSVEAAESLVRGGADVDARTADEVTPLQLAVDRSHLGMLELLLAAHADWREQVQGRSLQELALGKLAEARAELVTSSGETRSIWVSLENQRKSVLDRILELEW